MAGLPGPAPYFALINDPVLLAHPVVERRALFRRQQVEVSQGYLSLFEKTERVREDFPILLPFALSLDDRRSTFPARLAFLHVGTDPFGLGLVLVTVVHWKIRLAQGGHRELITTLVFQMAPRGQSGAWRGLRH